MAHPKSLPKGVGQSRTSGQRNLIVLISLGVFLVCAVPALASAAAETIRVPWPIWILIQIWNLGVWLFNSFWGLIAFIAFVPLKKMVLGAVLTLGGAFLPDIPIKAAKKPKAASGSFNIHLPGHGKISFRGAPRYAVLLVGVLIVLSSLWDGISASP